MKIFRGRRGGRSRGGMHRTQSRNRLVRPAPTRNIHQIITASSTSAANQITSLTSLPIAAYRLTVNSLSQAGAKVTLVALQVGIG
jgi:hypothetical protein